MVSYYKDMVEKGGREQQQGCPLDVIRPFCPAHHRFENPAKPIHLAFLNFVISSGKAAVATKSYPRHAGKIIHELMQCDRPESVIIYG